MWNEPQNTHRLRLWVNLASRYTNSINCSFFHSIGMCKIRRFLSVLSSFFHSSLLYSLSFYPFPPTSLPSSLASFCHLFLGLPLSLFVSKLQYKLYKLILLVLRFCGWSCGNNAGYIFINQPKLILDQLSPDSPVAFHVILQFSPTSTRTLNTS